MHYITEQLDKDRSTKICVCVSTFSCNRGGRFKFLKITLNQILNDPTLCIGFKRSTHCDICSSKSSSSERLFKVKLRASSLKFILVQTSSGIMAKVTVLSVREEMHQKEEGGRFCLDRFPTWQQEERVRRQNWMQQRNTQGSNSLGNSSVTYSI